MGSPWTPEEEQLLIEIYENAENKKNIDKIIQAKLKEQSKINPKIHERSFDGIHYRRNKLGLKKSQWTEEEKELLRKYYPNQDIHINCLIAVFKRSEIAIRSTADRLKIHRGFYVVWTYDKLLALHELYKENPLMSVKELAVLFNEKFDCDVSSDSVSNTLSRHGLRYRPPLKESAYFKDIKEDCFKSAEAK